jgi:putative PIN family toxin of toxin-antitoxin system
VKIRVVFDCNTFLQAALNEESLAGNCYRLVEEGTVELFVSQEVLDEIEDVINRPHIRERFDTLTDERIENFLNSIRNLAVIVQKIPQVFSLPRDIDDEIYINLAVEAEAAYIVTRDKDLIDLMTGFDLESKQFRQKFRPLKVVQPLEFLKIVEESLRKNISLKP